ncbi:Ent-kaur-16-ene synthase [Neonectria ditissima]|uniref:Ent-kaur-16-ene synthase n=1 Tax=Neonectria ditissima TaxID=78410 RepID=A0A0P7B6Y7_9HYPO|nr:Ent-kaur-16-ene synthase [Neonectria ditissima]
MKVEISSMDETQRLTAAARSLISRLSAGFDHRFGLSTTSCQVYDTAWVAMITKPSGTTKEWLFPESFHYLLKQQAADGSWGRHPVTQTAGILDTAAALLALLKHVKEPLQIHDVSWSDVYERIDRASRSLRDQLATWDDVLETNHIGVELIVPSLLEYLQLEDQSLTFEFPCKSALDSMKAMKLARFNLDSLYGKRPSSAIHSLEAFLGKLDFDRVSHQLFQGSMLASPSSTAAYLIASSRWDEEAEAYLRHIVKAGSGHGDGGIPGTFPTTNFEYSWAVATLLRSGFSKSDLESAGLQGIGNVLTNAFLDDGGVIGFAPRAVDVDDTAKGLLALQLLGQHTSPEAMLKVFERKDHFTTFGSERDPSLSSHCHVLIALLNQPDVSLYHPQILKATNFICNFWWNGDHLVKDKWHLSQLYPTMLVAEAFTDLLHLLDQGALPGIKGQELQWKVSICLFQACFRTLLEQQVDGSWNGMPEQTCYAILTLAQARRVCLFQDIQAQLQDAIERGVSFLKSRTLHEVDRSWTSKTAYRVAFVAEAYELAALKVSLSAQPSGSIGHSISSNVSKASLDGFARLVVKTPLFSELPEWHIQASLVESSLFVPLLRSQRLKVFPRDEARIAEDKYLDLIPFTWIGCNNRRATFAPTSMVYELMALSLLGYQVDEFIETVAAPLFPDTTGLHALIDEIIDNTESRNAKHGTNGFTNGFTNGNGTNGESSHSSSPTPETVTKPLTLFVEYVLNHETVAGSSSWDRKTLREGLRTFLHAHTTQIDDNSRFKAQDLQKGDMFTSATKSFAQWVRTTAADHVACPYSFNFACCLISSSLGNGEEVFPTVTQKYLAAATLRHLATMCRMYNDYGSIDRDTEERNINSVHFPEFAQSASTASEEIKLKKQALVHLGQYEYGCVVKTLEVLEQEALRTSNAGQGRNFNSRKMSIIKFFCDVTDFYDQLYFQRDLSSRIV